MSPEVPSPVDAADPPSAWLAVELLLLFFVLPGVLAVCRHHLHFLIMPLVLAGGICFGIALSRHDDFDQTAFLATRGLGRHVRGILRVFVPAGAVMTVVAFLTGPDYFLGFPIENTRFWLLIMVFYPLIGATLQETIFRGFFFHRYGGLFPNRWVLLVVNAVSFALFHLIYWNAVALALSFVGGLLFAWRYLRTGSLLAVAIEHGLWGDLLFTIGIGRFIFSGDIH